MGMVEAVAGSLAASRPSNRRWLGRDWRLGYALTLPVFLLIIGLIAYPLAYSIWLSLQDVKVGAPGTFVGLANYQRMMFNSDSRIYGAFWNSVRVTFLYTCGAMVVKLIIGMVAALILNAEIKARNFWRTLLFLPWAIPAIATTLTWKWMFNDVNGIINNFLMQHSIIDAPILFLASPNLALVSVLIAVAWNGTPFWMMTFLAGLQAIPGEMYEAAEIDGASTFNSFLYITLPNIASVVVVTMMLSAIWTTNSIQFVYGLTNGGPADVTQTFPLLALTQGLRAYDLGIGSAVPLAFLPLFAVMIYFLTRRMLRVEA